MADAKKCDRCKEYYDEPDERKPGDLRIEESIKDWHDDVFWRIKDLCPSCKHDLRHWLKYPNSYERSENA